MRLGDVNVCAKIRVYVPLHACACGFRTSNFAKITFSTSRLSLGHGKKNPFHRCSLVLMGVLLKSMFTITVIQPHDVTETHSICTDWLYWFPEV